MQVTMNTPANLVGQKADNLFDCGVAGIPRGSGPTGILGATLVIPYSLQIQAIKLGFTLASFTPG